MLLLLSTLLLLIALGVGTLLSMPLFGVVFARIDAAAIAGASGTLKSSWLCVNPLGGSRLTPGSTGLEVEEKLQKVQLNLEPLDP